MLLTELRISREEKGVQRETRGWMKLEKGQGIQLKWGQANKCNGS